ncbi:hypothetical protein NC653_036390 [Populus alba x Populus x berolinensis]|uniref:Uncharacterized protein n=2 Tax=Populus alba x Populus x berolinensis TaxID=444605 RepID=A0AAD6LK30_9ROSI|nr:hypothetical protein NC653_036390 [Populus alba x Populus x berolinensis]
MTPLFFGHSGCPRTRSLFQGGKKVAFKLWRMDAVGKMRKFEANHLPYLCLDNITTILIEIKIFIFPSSFLVAEVFWYLCVQLCWQIFVSLGGCFGGDKNILKVITLLIN